MKKSVKRVSILLTAVALVALTVTNAFAVTVYYYFGYLYTYIDNERVSLYGIDDPEMDGLFVPATLNGKSLVDIRNSAFKNNTDFRYLDFAGAVNLERIGSFAFSGCTTVAGEVKIPSNVTVIETAAFENCTSIETVVYDASCENVPNQCFNGCTALSSVSLSDSVNTIEDYAFANCPNLTYMVVPEYVTSIAATAFQNDSDLTLGVWYDSYAYTFAKNNSIPFVLLDEVMLGDADGDGVVNINDVTAIQRHVAEFEVLEDLQAKAADVNGDNSVSIEDATLVQQYLAEYEIDVPIGVV